MKKIILILFCSLIFNCSVKEEPDFKNCLYQPDLENQISCNRYKVIPASGR